MSCYGFGREGSVPTAGASCSSPGAEHVQTELFSGTGGEDRAGCCSKHSVCHRSTPAVPAGVVGGFIPLLHLHLLDLAVCLWDGSSSTTPSYLLLLLNTLLCWSLSNLCSDSVPTAGPQGQKCLVPVSRALTTELWLPRGQKH